MRRLSVAFLVLLALLGACSSRDQTFETNVEILRIRPIRRDLQDPSVILTVDVEMSYFECPGEQRKTIRGDKAFAACITKHKVGDKVPAKVLFAYDSDKGLFKNKITKLAECDRKLDPNDEASYEVVQDCEDLSVNGVSVGVHCDRQRSKELITKCPWFRVR